MVSKRIDRFVLAIDIHSKRLIGLELNIPKCNSIYLFSVYLPAITRRNGLFLNELEVLADVYNVYVNKGTVVLPGDFNCKIGGPRH